MNEVRVLAVPLDANISDAANAILAEKGVVIIRSNRPELVRLVTPTDDIDVMPANEYMWAALDALSMTGGGAYSQPDADKLRRKFVSNLNDSATRKRRKLIGWSSEIATDSEDTK